MAVMGLILLLDEGLEQMLLCLHEVVTHDEASSRHGALQVCQVTIGVMLCRSNLTQYLVLSLSMAQSMWYNAYD
jgi:hypothetical protein